MKKNLRMLKQIFPLIFFILMVLYTVSIIAPIIWSLLSSLKTNIDFTLHPFGLPKKWMFSNYATAFNKLYVEITTSGGFRKVYMWEMFSNTLIYALGSTIVSVMTRCCCAYITAKYDFRFKGLVYSTVIIVMILPIIGTTPSTLNLMRNIGFYDSMAGVIVMSGGFTGMNFLIFYATFKGISWDYAEAALVDGASHFKVMVQIMIPLARVTILILMVTSFIADWNNYTMPLLYIPSFPTISYGLYSFQFNKTNAIAKPPFIMAAAMLIFTPIFVIFLLLKEQLIGNLSAGGLKG